MGYRTLGNQCPVTRVPPGHPYSRFLRDMIDKYLEDAVDAEELLRVRERRVSDLDFLHPEQICEFAIYVVPDPASRFYQTGAALLGYDFFHTMGKSFDTPEPDVEFFRNFSLNAAQYGFHLTIIDMVYVEKSQLSSLICEATEIANNASRFNLKIEGLGENHFWESDLVLLCSESTGNLELLNSELVTRILPLSLGTNYTLNPTVIKNSKQTNPRDRLMTRNYLTPYVLQNYHPHFTLASSFDATPEEQARLRRIATERFLSERGAADIAVDQIYILSRLLGEEHWHLHPIKLCPTL